jgi:hypothetical protein
MRLVRTLVRRVQPRRVRGLGWASAISRANRFTRSISSANCAMGCRRRIFNTIFRRRLSMNNSLSATGRTSARLADEPSKTLDTDLGRMPTCPTPCRSWSVRLGTSPFPDSFAAFGKGLLRGIGVWNARASPSRVYGLAVGVGFGPALLFAFWAVARAVLTRKCKPATPLESG